MSPSIYPSIRGSASQNKRSPFDRSSNRFLLVGYFDKIILNIFLIYMIYIYIFIFIFIYVSIDAADRGSLEFDSRVLGDLVLPLIVWYMFSTIYFFIYLIYQGRWPWYILVKMIPKERSSWVSVPWMFQYIVNSYPPFGNHAKMGVDN